MFRGNYTKMDLDLDAFLRQRGIEEEVIVHLKKEKIDGSVIQCMNESQLQTYIPKYGDRIALLNFCKQNNTKKLGLLERLRNKLNKKQKKSDKLTLSSDEEDQQENKRLRGSRKNTRFVELGWLWSANGDKLIQVRAKQGGGTRKVEIAKTAKSADLLEKAKALFFPEGMSSKGHISKFSCSLLDFKNETIENDLTVEEIFKITSLTKLRFYLATRELVSTVTTSQHHESLTSLFNDDILFEISPIAINFEGETNTDLREVASIISHEPLEAIVNLNNIGTVYRPLSLREITSPDTPTTSIILTLHRGQVLNELITAFLSLDQCCPPLHIEMVMPNGKKEAGYDTGGVLRDALSEFWQSFYDHCTEGTKAKVPILKHDYNSDKWSAVAKILFKGYEMENYFPTQLCRPFLEQCIFGYTTTSLEDSFLQHVSSSEAEILSLASSDFNQVDMDELEEVLSTLKCQWKPTSTNIKTIITDIAHRDIIQKPMFIIDSWSPILKNMMTQSMFNDLYVKNCVTSKNVIKLLSADVSLSTSEENVMGFLKRFLRESDESRLKLFLRFCTGADVILGHNINIKFNKLEGFVRVPTAHTCGNILELSNAYDDYPDFRSEINSTLCSNIWVMDII